MRLPVEKRAFWVWLAVLAFLLPMLTTDSGLRFTRWLVLGCEPGGSDVCRFSRLSWDERDDSTCRAMGGTDEGPGWIIPDDVPVEHWSFTVWYPVGGPDHWTPTYITQRYRYATGEERLCVWRGAAGILAGE